jgi:GPH family glycoside/pentoside/hexuronide:cation symporter
MAASLFSLKIGLTVGGALVGYILAYYGFIANQTQRTETINGIILLLSIYPAVFGLGALILMFFYPLKNKMMIKIEEDLTVRRNEAQRLS